MIGLALGFLRIAWPYILGAILLGAVWIKADYGWCNHACQKATERAQTAEGKIKVAEQRATDIALLWAAQVEKTEQAVHAEEQKNAEIFADLKSQARAAAGRIHYVFPAESISLFDRARDAASTGPATVPDQAAPAPSGSAEEYIVELHEWASVCRARVEAWQAFYTELQHGSQ